MEDRQQEIMALLNKKGFMSVSQLAASLFISEPTVRRELSRLEKSGMICRPRGGAALLAREISQPSLQYQLRVERDKKQQMARAGAQLVQDNSSVFVSGSDITIFLLPFLAKKENVTVFTHGLSHAQTAARLGLHTVCLGGEVNDTGDVCRGFLTLKMVELLRVDMMFLAPPCIRENGDVMHYSAMTATLLSALFPRAGKTVIFCRDQEIWTRSGAYQLCRTDTVDYIVCGEPLPEALPQPRCGVIQCED